MTSRTWIAVAVAALMGTCSVAFGQGSAQSAQSPQTGDTLLNPETITITGSFEAAPSRTTALELAIRRVEVQSDKKREAEAAAAALAPVWQASFWKYLPNGGVSMNSPLTDESDADRFFAPEYLKLSYRLLDRELGATEKRALSLFSK